MRHDRELVLICNNVYIETAIYQVQYVCTKEEEEEKKKERECQSSFERCRARDAPMVPVSFPLRRTAKDELHVLA